MVLSNRSRCIVLTMVENFDHLLPSSKADMWSFIGRKSVAYIGYLYR
jgi:hypothetical protein